MQGRLDELAAQLQSEPEAEGYIIVYGVRRNRGRSFEKQAFAKTAKDYLTKTRSIDRGRVFNVSGKDGDQLRVELWVVNPYRTKRN